MFCFSKFSELLRSIDWIKETSGNPQVNYFHYFLMHSLRLWRPANNWHRRYYSKHIIYLFTAAYSLVNCPGCSIHQSYLIRNCRATSPYFFHTPVSSHPAHFSECVFASFHAYLFRCLHFVSFSFHYSNAPPGESKTISVHGLWPAKMASHFRATFSFCDWVCGSMLWSSQPNWM